VGKIERAFTWAIIKGEREKDRLQINSTGKKDEERKIRLGGTKRKVVECEGGKCRRKCKFQKPFRQIDPQGPDKSCNHAFRSEKDKR